MIKIGTAVATTDTNLSFFLDDLYQKKLINYVELYLKPETKISDLIFWNTFKFPIVLHAPHDSHASFKKDWVEFALWASKLVTNFQYVIFNAGLKGQGDIWQFGDLAYPEVMPQHTSFKELSQFTVPDEVKGKFCLDFAHVYLTEQEYGMKNHSLTRLFLAKNPSHFHVGDISNTTIDEYCPLGTGLLDLKWIIKELPLTCNVTIEVDPDVKDRKQSIEKDVLTFRESVLEKL